ncbi:hypothetical protein VKT23_019677 [Stygiomarasmius scandens]|uniref:F-box domain-containing protein n=1 Tax=Marasmiellus scandens TaxID=2682957 RepID=A0ABR1IP26_9AGAR
MNNDSSSRFPQEILEEIFNYLTQPYTLRSFDKMKLEVPSRRELLSCVLACKAFSLPALRVLWHTLDSMMPLLKLLPNFKIVDDCYVLVGSIDNASSQRFDFYSLMVKRFLHRGLYDMWDDCDITDSVYHHLSIMRPMPLPSLTSFYYDVTDTEDPFHWMSFFLSASLKAAYVHIHPRNEADLLIYLSLVREVAPSFNQLVVENEVESTTCYLEVASQLENLHTLHLTFPGSGHSSPSFQHDVRRFGALQFLEELRVESENEEWISGDCQVAGQFPSLKRLYLGGSHSLVVTFLDVCQDAPLELLQMLGELDNVACQGIFKTVARQWSETLTSFSIDPVITSEGNLGDLVNFSNFIEPLYSSHRLRVFRLMSSRAIYMTDTDVAKLCDAWPHLTNLEINVAARGVTDSPTQVSLLTLSQRCPKLKQVTLPLYLSDIPPLNDDIALSLPLSSHKLEKIDILINENTPVNPDPILVAFHLDATFSHLKKVTAIINHISRTWNEVENVIRTYQIMRRRHGIRL